MSTTTRPAIVQPVIEPIPNRSGEYRLRCEQLIPRPREDVFAFFADAYELERITPSWLHFQVLTPRPIEMETGALIDYRLRLHGIPMKWKTEISLWEPSFRFVDQQLRGPYKYWHHTHMFEEVADGTLVTDTVAYGVPGGRLLHWLIVRRDLERIFQHRQQSLQEIFADSVRE